MKKRSSDSQETTEVRKENIEFLQRFVEQDYQNDYDVIQVHFEESDV